MSSKRVSVPADTAGREHQKVLPSPTGASTSSGNSPGLTSALECEAYWYSRVQITNDLWHVYRLRGDPRYQNFKVENKPLWEWRSQWFNYIEAQSRACRVALAAAVTERSKHDKAS